MLDKQGFNVWSDSYDETVWTSEKSETYPFAGYSEILKMIYEEAMRNPDSAILDIGFGTGVLTSKLYQNGHVVTGIDFSSEMISQAQSKMPKAKLIEWDISTGLPEEIKKASYDTIISTYTLHHLTDKEKVHFINELSHLLYPGGQILIGDISFETRRELEECHANNLIHWDDAEAYFVHEELEATLQGEFKLEYTQISHCGGVYIIYKPK